MATLSAFFAENAERIDNIKFPLSKRFKDPETGEAMEWEMRPLTAKESSELQRANTKKKTFKGKTVSEIDGTSYVMQSVAKSIVFPDLNDAALQNSYGAMDSVSLLETMLYSSEQTELILKFNELNGFDKTMEELGDEAKN